MYPRYLWVKFQLESMSSYTTDQGILAALDNLPKDLTETYDRCLLKMQSMAAYEWAFCKRTYQLITSA